MLIRSKNLIEPITLFQTFFLLMKCQDKTLRKFLYTHMLNEVKKIKTKLRNHKLCTVKLLILQRKNCILKILFIL